MNSFEIGKYIQQINNYKAFVPNTFPPKKELRLPKKLLTAHTEAVHLLGKLDGVADRLPDKDWFLMMFISKDASRTIKMDLPKDILLAADISEANAAADLRKYLALFLFKERILSFGKAAELSGIDKLTFLEFAGSKGVSLNYDTDDYCEDIETINGFKI